MDLQRFAEKTEAATPRRRQEAQQKGRVPRSAELTATAALLAAGATLISLGPDLFRRLLDYAAARLGSSGGGDLTAAGVQALALQAVLLILRLVLPLALAGAGAAVLVAFLQGGFVFSLRPLAPDFSRISPAQGFTRLFSRRAAAEALKAVAKLALIAWIAYGAVRGQVAALVAAAGQPASVVAATIAGAAGSLLLRVTLALAAVAAFDYFFQRREFEQQLRMTKQELKEELRQTEGNPEVRQRVRRRQKEVIRRRMLHDVKKSSVVVTNPTHYAVALLYVAGMAAPKVVAKGQGWLALRIRELAAEHDVPLIENPPLARALYQTVELGRPISAELYQAVAEVLALVYRLRGRIPGTA